MQEISSESSQNWVSPLTNGNRILKLLKKAIFQTKFEGRTCARIASLNIFAKNKKLKRYLRSLVV